MFVIFILFTPIAEKRKKFSATNVSLLGFNCGDRKPKKHEKYKNCNPRKLDNEVKLQCQKKMWCSLMMRWKCQNMQQYILHKETLL
jgi:hypothetical protein